MTLIGAAPSGVQDFEPLREMALVLSYTWNPRTNGIYFVGAQDFEPLQRHPSPS